MVATQTQIRQLNNVRRELLESARKFPRGRHDEVLFGRWGLKDILAHISAWSWYSISCLESVRLGREPAWELHVQAFNQRETKRRRNWSFSKVLKELDRSSRELVRAYRNFDQSLWNKKFWPKRKWTPKKFLEIDLEHYRKDHLPKIKRAFKTKEIFES